MATIQMPLADDNSKSSVVDDFMYGSNVAQSHIYVRMGFLRKVYGILSAQLALTTMVGVIFMSNETIKGFVQQNQWMMMLAMFGTFGILFALLIKRMETPANYILLFVFTCFEAYTVGVIVTFYDVHVVLQAFALTFAVTVSLTAYTLQSKYDFSAWGASLFAALWILTLGFFVQLFFPSETVSLAISIGGAILFSLFIVFDTHMLLHRHSPEEYIVAAINLYLDIINLFLHILRIVSEANRK